MADTANTTGEEKEERRPTLFLSYAHADARRAQAIAAALGQRGYTVWWDSMIEGGASFAKSIGEALEAADAVVVLWSASSIQSDWVADEAAQGRDRKRLVPLSLDGSLPPLGFRQYQTIDLNGRNVKPSPAQVERIERAIGAAVGHVSPGRQPQGPVSPRAVDRRRALAIGGGAAIVLAGGGALFVYRDELLGSGTTERSIAVLPFKNVSGDAAQAYLSDGLTEEIRAALSRNAQLQVLAGTSSNTARDHTDGAVAIAAKLGVASLLEGSVQRAGDIVRVAIDLTDGRNGFSIWSKRIDAKLTDIFAFQSEVARIVSHALSVRMATQDPAPGGTRNVAAFDSYLRGKALYNLSKDEASDRQAVAMFQNSVALDPGFALGHAGLSRSLASVASVHASGPDIRSTFAAASAEAQKAVELSPSLAEAHLALGYARFAGFFDFKGARAAYDQAYRYGRGSADILLVYAMYSIRAGRPKEASDAIERAIALDPLNPRTHRAAGTIAFAERDYAGAVTNYRRALQLNPAISNANAFLGLSLIQLKRLAEARKVIAAEKSGMFRLTALAIAEQRAGDRAAAARTYDQLVGDYGESALYQQAQVMAQLGRTDEAFALLERARRVGDAGLTAVASDPLLDPIATDPRFKAFVRSFGLS